MPVITCREVPSDEGSYEFECEDCRQPVCRAIRVGGIPDATCFVCQVTAALPPVERDAARARLRGDA